ncbi:MAG: hydroxyacid dehydrogenase [Chloroflexota bacterium]
MADPLFRVGFRGRPMHEAFLDVVGRAPTLDVGTLNVPDEELASVLAQTHGYYVSSARNELPLPFHVTSDLIAKMPSLILAVTYGAGYDTVNVDACTRAGIAVVNQAGGNAEGVAEHALGMMLSLLKRMPETHIAMKAGGITEREAFMGRELAGRTVGIIGLGHVGSRTATYLKAFGCRVLAYDPHLDEDTCAARGAKKTELDALLEQSDVVSVHCPLNSETEGMLGAREYALMPEGAILVNTARGGIPEEGALFDALESGHLAGAGLDAWAVEPPPEDHPLLSHPRVIGTVHTGGVTHESRARVAEMAGEAFVAAAAGELPPRIVNPEVIPAYIERWAKTFGRPFPGATAR